jgi:hypothetical protein
VALQLSGHTHGGLVVGLERIFALANGGYESGRYDVDGMTLYVSNGTALWAGLALRLGKPSELTRITLRRCAGCSIWRAPSRSRMPHRRYWTICLVWTTQRCAAARPPFISSTALPLAFAIGKGWEMQQPLFIAIITGLAVRLPLILVPMPVLA